MSYKKSELMLMGRATASVQFRMQVVLVYLRYISAKIHSKCASQPKIVKNSLKPIFWGFEVVQGHRQQCLFDKQQVCVYLQPFSRQMR